MVRTNVGQELVGRPCARFVQGVSAENEPRRSVLASTSRRQGGVGASRVGEAVIAFAKRFGRTFVAVAGRIRARMDTTTTTRIELRSPPMARSSTCRCGARIQWATTIAGRKIPIEVGSGIERVADAIFVRSSDVHFANCSFARDYRRGVPSERAELQRARDQILRMRAELTDSVPRVRLEMAQSQQTRLRLLIGRTIERMRRAGCHELAEQLSNEFYADSSGAIANDGAKFQGD